MSTSSHDEIKDAQYAGNVEREHTHARFAATASAEVPPIQVRSRPACVLVVRLR